jgi:hypothetical protein
VGAGGVHLAAGSRADVVDAVRAVFLVAAPLAAIALAVVLRLPERPLIRSHG